MPAVPFQAKLLRHSGETGIVEVSGEIDMHTSRELDEILTAVVQSEPERVVVDLSATGFIDSTGLSVLVQNAKAALAGGASFEIVCTDKLMQVFEITGLDDVLAFHSTRAEALL